MLNDPTNLKIAQLLKLQTYDERMEMAQWFRDVALDAKTDDRELDDDLFAFWLGSWAEQEADSYDQNCAKPSQPRGPAMLNQSLEGLIERVAGASGPDREIDKALAVLSGWTTTGNAPPPTGVPDYWYTDAFGMPAYTSSIDAALGLFERLLPGWTIARMSQGDNKLWTVELREGFLTSYSRVVIEPSHSGYRGTTLPLALILATLRAIQHSKTGDAA